MDWFIFVLIAIIWLISLAFFLDKKTLIRGFLTGAMFFFIGAILITSGITYPNGWTIITSGSTQTITQTFTSTTTTAPYINLVGWGLFFFGFYFMIEVWTYILTLGNSAIHTVRDFFGFN